MNTQIKKEIINFIDSKRALAIELETLLTSIPAISPESGGEGELKKCEALECFLRKEGITELERIDIDDSNAVGGRRPNLIAVLRGQSEDTLWFISHIDVVPPGEIKLWQSNPWELCEKDGKLYGRGAEDNQQGLVSSVIAALALKAAGVCPQKTVKLLFAADEECGSVYGMAALVERDKKLAHAGAKPLFKAGDVALIPDGGDSLGAGIEVAEKHLLWLKLSTIGRQTHGSRPDTGTNAFLAGCALALRLRESLLARFNMRNALFEPDYSTFEPSKKEPNVSNINTIPGEDVFYMDMRILPCYSTLEVLNEVRKVADGIETEYGVSIRLEPVQRVESPPTSTESPLVTALSGIIEETLGIKPKPVGIGGGTVASFLRNMGIDAVVWSKLDDTAHNPNEYAIVDNILDGAKVMALLAAQYSG
ncbi:MAG: M20 family metallo-hydrolase [Spirochaetaceae bacterium]|jgi:succinyl-diaminopimelate desuccinylase|nr:M20 family metallo-hydrolase [Spirochaetaceae bacterium]